VYWLDPQSSNGTQDEGAVVSGVFDELESQGENSRYLGALRPIHSPVDMLCTPWPWSVSGCRAWGRESNPLKWAHSTWLAIDFRVVPIRLLRVELHRVLGAWCTLHQRCGQEGGVARTEGTGLTTRARQM
jgi:hypothetical protein